MSQARSGLPLNRQILDEAAEWFVELNEGETDLAARERFDQWLRRSPEHIRAYLGLLPIWESGAGLGAEANGDPQRLIAWTRVADNIVTFDAGPQQAEVRRGESSAGIRRRRGRYLALAASLGFLLIALGAAVLWQQLFRGVYTTEIGEQRWIAFNDGSTVQLNSRSRLKVRFDSNVRAIDLLEGQALFDVARDRMRPFVVRSGDTRVRAIGTQFDVNKKTSGVTLTVLEGRVALLSGDIAKTAAGTARVPAAIYLGAGQQITVPFAKPRRLSPIQRTDAALATAWTQQRLVFSKALLVDVVEEFNRHNPRQIVIPKGELASFRLSGAFSSTDSASLIRFLRSQPGMVVEESGSEVRVREK